LIIIFLDKIVIVQLFIYADNFISILSFFSDIITPMPQQKKKIVIEEEQINSINRVLSTLAFGLITIIGLQYIAKDLIAPILLAIFFTVILYPVFRWFRKRGFSSKISLLLMIVTFFIGGAAIIIFLTWSFSLLAQSLSSYVASFKETFAQTAQSVNISSETASQVTSSITPQNLGYVGRLIMNSLGNIVFYFILIPILSMLMILQIDSMPSVVSDKLSKSNKSVERFKKFAESIMIYVSSRFKVNLATGILFSVALIILGVPFPFVWGLLAVLMSFIPYVGIVIACIPPVLLAFSIGGLVPALLVIGAMAVINVFAENVLSPVVLGRGSKLSTAAVVISLIFWVWLLGPIGAILSVPLTVFLKIILSDFKETQFLSLLMEGNYNIEKPKNGKSIYKKTINKFVSFVPSKKSK
jgi:AI-2 transport protein TqsA